MDVIGTVGLPGSGKGEIAAVAERADIPVVTMGDVIREACRNRGLDPAEHHGNVARTLREEDGPSAIAERSLPQIDSALETHPVVVVDGLRSDIELSEFRDHYGDSFTLISVEAPFELRADRLNDRSRDASDSDREALRAREERELSFGMNKAMSNADIVMKNTSSLATFRHSIREFFHTECGVEFALTEDIE
jgi:Dephospho-CoA kinase